MVQVVDVGDEKDKATGIADIAGEVRALSEGGLPRGYVYGATRYADVILRESFPGRYKDIVDALELFSPTLTELRTSGGGRTVFVGRFDESLREMSEGDARIRGKPRFTDTGSHGTGKAELGTGAQLAF